MKLVSDFDGVLTELSSEADRVKQLFVGFLELGSELNRFEEELKQNPHLYGWNIHGRITAYSDEDSLIYNNALAAYLDSLSQSESILQTSLQKLSLKGITDFKQAAQKAYLTMCEEVLNSNATPIDSKTSPVLGSLLNSGAEVVVVSNSGSERIQNIFSKAGILSHSFPIRDSSNICVRGGAMKFQLGEKSRTFMAGTRPIEVARPIYEQMILEERPDAVIGDVFSLDLALPFQLAKDEPSLFPNGLKLILRKRHYTPNWVLDFVKGVGKQGAAQFFVLEDLKELEKILNA